MRRRRLWDLVKAQRDAVCVALRARLATLDPYAFEPGVAPITLIDGEKLLNLLIAHGLGVRTGTVELLELDEGALAPAPEAGGAADA
ncbi:hypothetical protein tb265_20360 [Gemmatimonadetes bacterium T265]|nr:hypothetical protein tb265_20360 [Gemmatimonadetes bacterium T265]